MAIVNHRLPRVAGSVPLRGVAGLSRTCSQGSLLIHCMTTRRARSSGSLSSVRLPNKFRRFSMFRYRVPCTFNSRTRGSSRLWSVTSQDAAASYQSSLLVLLDVTYQVVTASIFLHPVFARVAPQVGAIFLFSSSEDAVEPGIAIGIYRQAEGFVLGGWELHLCIIRYRFGQFQDW
jgi:hypothetical protein